MCVQANGPLNLKSIFESTTWKKFFFDPRSDCDALFNLYNVQAVNVICLQLADVAQSRAARQTRDHVNGLVRVLGQVLTQAQLAVAEATKEAGKRLFAQDHGGSYDVFRVRPLHPTILSYCVADIVYFPLLESRLYQDLDRNWKDWVQRNSADRVNESLSSVRSQGRVRALAPH